MQNIRTLILGGIFIVVLIYYLISTFVLTDKGNSVMSDMQSTKFEQLSARGGMVKAINYADNPGYMAIWGNDPFYYPMPTKNSGGFKSIFGDISLTGPGLKLQGIVWSNDNIPTILINNEVLKLGGQIDGYRVVNVGTDYVVLRKDNERLQLTLGE